jgi:hypothetical protein
MLGEYERELEYANFGLERFPHQAVFYSHKACALAAMGRTEAVDKIIDEVLRVQTSGVSAGGLMSQVARELWVHGHRQKGDLIAARSVEWYEAHPSTRREEYGTFRCSLWMLGRWRQLEDFAAEMIDSDSTTVHGGVYWHGVLGVIAAIEGNRERAMQISEELPVWDYPYASAYRYYWRAAITAHLGDGQRAVELLAEAFSLGLSSSVSLHRAPEFEPLWDYPPFQELIEPKG